MTRLFSFGFESAEELELFDTIQSPSITSIVATELARTGGNVLQFHGTGNDYCAKLFAIPGRNAVYVGGAVRATTDPTVGYVILSFGCGQTAGQEFNAQCSVKYLTGNAVGAYIGNTLLAQSVTGVAPINGNWVYIEVYLEPADAGGRFVIKCDGATVVDYTGDTNPSGTPTGVTGIAIHDLFNSAANYVWWDDVVYNDDSGTDNNTYPGQVRLQPIRTVAAGDVTQLSRGGVDLGANFRQVRDASLSTFVQGSLNQYDLYDVDDPDLPAGATIKNIIVEVIGNSISGAGEVATMVKGATTEDQGSDQVLATGVTVRQEAYPENPDDSAAWEETDLADLQIGVKMRT